MIPHRVRSRAACALLFLSAVFFSSRALADDTAMSAYGVNANPHSYASPDSLAFCDQVIASNVKWVRMGPEWGSIETARGVYSSSRLAQLDAIVNRFHDAGVNILWILCYTAPWASSEPGMDKPDRYKPANWSDWENYVSFITQRYQGKVRHWEVWNEPDHFNYWRNSVADYRTLLQKAYAKVKATDAGNTVLMAGVAMSAEPYGIGSYFDQIMEAGAGPYFDVVNYHAYGRLKDKTRGVRDVMAKHGIGNRPMWMTETGYSTEGVAGRELERSVRVDENYLHNETTGVDRTFWYTYRSRTLNPPNPSEENFGLVAVDLTPTKGFYHYQALGGAQTNFRLQAAYPDLTPTTLTLYHVPATTGDGSYVVPVGDDRRIPATRFMYLRVNDLWLYDANGGIDDSVTVSVTYLDTGTDPFTIQYDSTTNAYRGVTVPRNGTGKWQTAVRTLPEVKFANRQNNAADLRIQAGASDLTVRDVTVYKHYDPAVVVLGQSSASKLLKLTLPSDPEADSNTLVATKGGVECRRIDANNRYFYFPLSDAFAQAGDTELSVRITFWDEGTDKLALHYNAIGNPYKAVNIQKTNTNVWRTVVIDLADAHFVNAQNYSADFRIGNAGDGSDEHVSRVEVAHRATGAARSNFRLQAAYPDLHPDTLPLYYVPAATGDGSYVVAAGDDRRVPATRYMYFRVNNLWLYDANGGVDDQVTLEITWLDAGTDPFIVHYDSDTGAYRSVSIPRTNTGAWKTATRTLDGVKFANRQNNAADFRISAGASDLTVREVAIHKHDAPAVAVLRDVPASKLLWHVTGTSGEIDNPVATMGGVECRQITANNRYFYFRVDDAFVRPEDAPLSIGVTFWDAGTDNLTLYYNAIGNPYKAVNIQKTNTNAWRTVTVALSDARFIKAQNQSADFRIGNGGDGGAEYVSRVEVDHLPLDLVSLDHADLLALRGRADSGVTTVAPVRRRLIEQADALLSAAPLSVMDKLRIPPSGDKHDYFSIGYYSWPNPDTPDGLPYIRRDGYRNPEADDATYDKSAYSTTVSRVGLLSLAWFYDRNEVYAAKAAQLLRTWFINPATRMNPSLNHAASQPGVNDGHWVGIIEGVVLIEMLDHVKLLSSSTSWTDADDAALKLWFYDYTTWLLESEFGALESAARNNHSTWYAAQVAAFSLYTGHPARVQTALGIARREIGRQIDADGSMPKELERNRSLMYSIYGLRPLAALARCADFVGEDLWHYQSPEGRGIGLAFDFLVPYLTGEQPWGWEEVVAPGSSEYVSALSQAAVMTRLAADGLGSSALSQATERIVDRLPVDSRRARLMMLSPGA